MLKAEFDFAAGGGPKVGVAACSDCLHRSVVLLLAVQDELVGARTKEHAKGFSVEDGH